MEKGEVIFGDIFVDTDSDPRATKGSDFILNSVKIGRAHV
jgi:hypothetical protein